MGALAKKEAGEICRSSPDFTCIQESVLLSSAIRILTGT